MIQLSILKIDGYGPWTLTLGSDREHELQILQASIYMELQKEFSKKNCLVFLNRADEFFVASNSLDLKDHIEIQKNLNEKFDVKLSISIGYGESPFEANQKAYEGKKNKVSLSDEHNIFGFVNNTSEKQVTILHCLTFFMGGDNFMVISSLVGKKNAKDFIELIKKEDGILLNCGVGTGKTSREAVSLATKSLDTIREIRDSGKEKPEVYELQC